MYLFSVRYPLKFVVEGKYDVKLYPEDGESTTILNVKRGIISALAVPLEEEDMNKKMVRECERQTKIRIFLEINFHSLHFKRTLFTLQTTAAAHHPWQVQDLLHRQQQGGHRNRHHPQEGSVPM